MDLLRFNPCNLDHLTETYNIGFYLDYFTRWPQLCKVMENESGQIEAYSMYSNISPSCLFALLCFATLPPYPLSEECNHHRHHHLQTHHNQIAPSTAPPANVLLLPTVLGKLESSPYPAPIEPYDPNLKIYQKKFPNYLPWHAHITCLTVAPAARRKGFATKLSEALEVVGDEQDCWFVDLFVRVENEAAIQLYKRMG